MTLTINDFVITGTPEEINTFIKVYSKEPQTYINPHIYKIPTGYVDPNEWITTCGEYSPCHSFEGDNNECVFK